MSITESQPVNPRSDVDQHQEENSESNSSGEYPSPPDGWPGGHAQRAFIESIFAAIREPLLVLDSELRVCLANGAYLEHFQVSRAETVGRTLVDVSGGLWNAPGLLDKLEHVLARSTELKAFEVRGRHDGASGVFSLTARRLASFDGSSASILLFVEDITERTRTRALLENERRFREVIDALPVAVYLTDAEGRITHANPASIELSGRQPSLGNDRWCVSWKLYAADGTPLPPDKCPMAIALQDGNVVHGGEYIIERPDGVRRWFSPYPTPIREADGTIVGGINMLLDITDRKVFEESQREEDLRYRSLVEQVKDYAIFRTDPRGIATTWNEGVKRLFGFEESDFIGEEIAHLIFTEEDVAADVPNRELVDAAEVGQVINDRWMRRKDGTRFYATGVTSALRDADGRLIGYSKVKRDQTTQKRLEDDLRESSAELSEAGRRKDEFLATLAHELRNPLAPIQNALRVLQVTDGDADAVRKASQMLDRQVNQMVRLVDDLLDVSRISRGTIALRRETISLSSAIEAAVDSVRSGLEAVEKELTVRLPPNPVYVDGDSVRIAQIIGNLLNNAVKFTGDGGKISLSLENAGSDAVLRIKDSGIGIARDQLPRVFDLFTQVDTSLERSAGGLGIGLALVKSLVELHDGTVEAHSDGPGRGSEFVIRLSQVAAPEPVETVEAESTESVGGPGRLVLVADDNVDSAESLAILLEFSGHVVHTVADGVAAVEAAASLRPHAAVLDIGMPRLNGFDACREIRKQPWGKDMLLVALSGWAQAEDRIRSREAGFDAHLVKPVDHDALMKLIASAGDGANDADAKNADAT